MAVVNRCAVRIYPSGQLLDWTRGLDLDVEVAGASEPCLYLIPDYDTQEEAEEIIEDVYKAIFEAELDYWHRDTGAWPAESTYPAFRKWFEGALLPPDPGPGGHLPPSLIGPPCGCVGGALAQGIHNQSQDLFVTRHGYFSYQQPRLVLSSISRLASVALRTTFNLSANICT